MKCPTQPIWRHVPPLGSASPNAAVFGVCHYKRLVDGAPEANVLLPTHLLWVESERIVGLHHGEVCPRARGIKGCNGQQNDGYENHRYCKLHGSCIDRTQAAM